MPDDILDVLRGNIRDVLFLAEDVDISPECSMKDYGANSIDRVEIIVQTMASLGLKIPLRDFSHIKNIGELESFLNQHVGEWQYLYFKLGKLGLDDTIFYCQRDCHDIEEVSFD